MKTRWNFYGYYFKYNQLNDLLETYKNNVSDIKTVNIFIDLQNALRTQYYDDSIQDGYYSVKSKERYSPIVFDTITYLARTRSFFDSKGIKSRFIIYWDEGKCVYHTSLLKDYKHNRYIKSTVLPDEVVKTGLAFFKMQKRILTELGNKLKDVYVIRMKNLETDFMPHFILKANPELLTDLTQVNFLISADKDLYQTTLLSKNVIQYVRAGKESFFINSSNAMKKLIKSKDDNCDSNLLKCTFSIAGDPGDDIPSVLARTGYITAYKICEQLKNIDIDVNELISNVAQGEQIKIDLSKITNKTYRNKIQILMENVERWRDNIFLTLFDESYKYFNNEIKYDKIKVTSDYRRKVINIVKNIFTNKEDIINYNVLKETVNYIHRNEELDNICHVLCEV